MKASSNLTKPRFSVVVSKKISKSAVVRNRYKRRVYNAIEDIFKKSNENYSAGVYIFFPKVQIGKLDFENLKLEIGRVLRQTAENSQ